MDNVKNSIWLNTKRKDSAVIYGIYYEFYNSILYRGMFRFDEEFNLFLNNSFINYISNLKDKDIDYKVLFSSYIDDLLNVLSVNNKNDIGFQMLSMDINSFKNALNDINGVFPCINIINNLSLSYQTKTDLMELTTDFSNNLYDTLESFFNDKETDKLYELIINNVYDYLRNSDDIDEYKKTFYESNRNFIEKLEKENILSLDKIDKDNDFDIDTINKKERHLLFTFIKETLIYGSADEIDMISLMENSNMSKIGFYYNTKSLLKKIQRQGKTKKRVK